MSVRMSEMSSADDSFTMADSSLALPRAAVLTHSGGHIASYDTFVRCCPQCAGRDGREAGQLPPASFFHVVLLHDSDRGSALHHGLAPGGGSVMPRLFPGAADDRSGMAGVPRLGPTHCLRCLERKSAASPVACCRLRPPSRRCDATKQPRNRLQLLSRHGRAVRRWCDRSIAVPRSGGPPSAA